MRKIKTIGIIFGFIFFSFIFCGISFIAGSQKAQAEPVSFNFTYVSSDTDEVGTLDMTTTFRSKLTNTGTEADSYVVTMIKNPPIPAPWTILFCSGGVCHPPSVTEDTVFLPAGEWDSIYVEITPRVICDDGSVTMRVTSIKSPGLTKSITFVLRVPNQPGCVPVTNRWGLFALIILISISGFYLIWRRLKPVRVT